MRKSLQRSRKLECGGQRSESGTEGRRPEVTVWRTAEERSRLGDGSKGRGGQNHLKIAFWVSRGKDLGRYKVKYRPGLAWLSV